MIKRIFLLCFCCYAFIGIAQNEVTIEAYVLDVNTKAPIPYVNIGFLDQHIGTVSDADGKFRLVYDENRVGPNDGFQISTLGYKTITIKASQLEAFLTNTNTFYLKPQPLDLETVHITNEKLKELYLGSSGSSHKNMGYWKDKEALGGEIVTRLKIRRPKTRLLSMNFNVLENTSDSLKVRVNIYNYKKGQIGRKLVTKNIFKTIPEGAGSISVDLEPYGITVDDDVVIGIELVRVYGNSINFALSASLDDGMSWTRNRSQSEWERFRKIGMHFRMKAARPVKDGKETIVLRDIPERITLYWDRSLAMKDRDIDKELNLLEKYFKKLGTVNLEVIAFNGVEKERSAFVVGGHHKAWYHYLKNTTYNGVAGYTTVLKENAYDADMLLVSTQGRDPFSTLETEVYVPTMVINSQKHAAHEALQNLANYADGYYINLSEISVKEALHVMQHEIEDTRSFESNAAIVNAAEVIKGTIRNASGPIQNAKISVRNTFIEAVSDVDGHFEIAAEIDAILEISALGMLEKQVLASEDMQILMESDHELLEEILIEAKKQEAALLDTGYGKRSEDAVGYSVNTLTADAIKPYHTTLAQVIQGQFAGVEVEGLNVGYTTPRFVIRGGGGSLRKAYAMFDIDGLIYAANQDLPPIDIQTIESITILKSLVATNRYGTVGQGGAIVIKTKRGSGDANSERIDQALVTGNAYSALELPLIGSNETKPDYIKELETATSFEAAKTLYQKQRKRFQSVAYTMDVHHYFMTWNLDYALSVLTNIAVMAPENPKALRAMAYRLDMLEQYELASKVYEKIRQIRPFESQSYRDLALSYVNIKQYQEAMDLYLKMLNNTISGVSFEGVILAVKSELGRLVSLHASQLDTSKLPKDFLDIDFNYDMRLVFEWNDPSMEFELQFVNPEKKFYKWSHTMIASKALLMQEAKEGYQLVEHIIDDAENGEWMVNLQNYSIESLKNPTYLKYTLFKNYGKSNEVKIERLIKLYAQSQKVTLDTFYYQANQ